MRKAYLLVFSDSTGDKELIKSWLNSEPKVLHWRTDLPHAFYVISEDSASALAESLMTFNNRSGRFLFTEVTENRQGLLPSDSWYLLKNKYKKPAGV